MNTFSVFIKTENGIKLYSVSTEKSPDSLKKEWDSARNILKAGYYYTSDLIDIMGAWGYKMRPIKILELIV